MHSWGDKGVDWKGINQAAEYIGVNLARWGFVRVVQYKEKFGTVRVYCYLGRCNRYLDYLLIPYQEWLYRKLYKDMVKKFPHLREEILCMADFPELLMGL